MLLVSGCSFVDNSHFPTALFGEDVYCHEVSTILAKGGAGNQYISASIIENVNCDTDYVFVMFSGLGRIDVPIPIEMEDEVELYWHRTTMNDKIWFHSGGFGGSWTDWTNPRSRYARWLYDYLKVQYKPMNYDYLADLSFTHILSCLNLLEQKNIPYRWGFIYDIHQDYSSTITSLSGNISKDHPRLNELPEHTRLPTTPYEWCKTANLLDPTDDFHPSEIGYQKWADSIKHLVKYQLT